MSVMRNKTLDEESEEIMFKKIIEKIKYYFSHEACYNDMEQQGIAAFGKCCGIVGGDNITEYLSYECIDCPYLCLSESNEVK